MILAIAVALLLTESTGAQTAATYASIVDQYIAGDAAGAVKRLAPSSARLPGDVVSQARLLPDHQIRAAVMMHTELAAASLIAGEAGAAMTQIGNAARLLGILTDDVRRRTSSETFAIRWYAFTTNLLAAQGLFERALRMIRDGITAFPGAAELYVARGAVYETRANIGDTDPRNRIVGDHAQVSKDMRSLMESAAADFQRALDVDPGFAVAKLHRGWIHHRLGDRRAAQELDAALVAATDDRLRYLAHLFRGAAAEAREDLEGARVEFEAAKTLGAYQTSYVALGRIETALGHAERAREIATEYAQLRERAEDPWWDYCLGGFTSGALEWLRQEARRQ